MTKANDTQPDPKERVRVNAPAGHTHAGHTLAKAGEIILRREQAERLGYEILGPAPAPAPDAADD